MDSDWAIDLEDVRKTYRGKVEALRGVDMKVRRGEIFGLLGPNGAGKSTLVKIMMTVVRPSRVRGTILGKPVGHKATLGRLGYLPEHHRMPGYLTGRQVLDYYGSLARVPRAERDRRAPELLERVGMSEAADRRISGYSKGMLQRVGLAQAMINQPDVVVLDEPTDGVDPVGRRDIRDLLVELRNEGKTIFLNSHLLSELEMVCDRVVILVKGQVEAHGTLDELTADSRRYEVEIAGSAPAWTGEAGAESKDAAGDRCVLTIPNDDPLAVQPIIDRLRADGRTVTSVRPVRESLEDLFIRVAGGDGDGLRHGGPRPVPVPPPPATTTDVEGSAD